MMNSGQNIKRISQDNAYRICSGQSIVDLSTAVKELLENAMDAGASVIEIRLKENGKERIEVIDNGKGIAKEDYENVVLKHFTSKISQFDDLESVATFGFRGEALSSLCQLAGKLTIFTRTESDHVGTLLEFDAEGRIISQTSKARPVGTTVTVEKLFQPLPVRLKDFHKNIKKHYTKLLRILQGYALIGTKVKLMCVNAVGKGPTQRALATQLNGELIDKISNVFGTKFSKTLIPVHISFGELGKVVGYVSKAGEGVGRADSDRQFFYVNERPVNLSKFVRGLNEVWRTYEMKHKPACVLNFTLPSGIVDVNVTPDKRETFIVNQDSYLEQFKAGLDSLWQPSRGKFSVQSQFSFTPVEMESSKQAQSVEVSTVVAETAAPNQMQCKSPVKRPRDQVESDDDSLEETATSSVETATSNLMHRKSSAKRPRERDGDLIDVTTVASTVETTASDQACRRSPVKRPRDKLEGSAEVSSVAQRMTASSSAASSMRPASKMVSIDCTSDSEMPTSPLESRVEPPKDSTSISTDAGLAAPELELIVNRPEHTPVLAASVNPGQDCIDLQCSSDSEEKTMVEPVVKRSFKSRTIGSCIDSIRARRQMIESRRQARRSSHLHIPPSCSSNSNEPVDPDSAAEAFEKILKKGDFEKMEILGQFNLGFILTRLGNDLFIIDQHASDEKHTFEKLQQSTKIHQQPLVCPQALELTAIEEMTVLDRISVFEQNGFKFHIDPNAETSHKVRLRAIPFSKQTQFGAEDVRELVSMLIDSPEKKMIRLPKLMAMYASRACRTSVMIGTALKKDDQVRIVRNLSTLQQPWNCPHGRPTLRHLVDLSKVQVKTSTAE